MENYVINAELRTDSGKGVARSLRRQGMVPGVIYREGKSQPLKINTKEMLQFFKSTSGEQVIVNIKFADGNNKLALLKEYTVDPVKGFLLHADFFEVSLTEKIKAMVHITTHGEPIGVKRDGGLLQHGLRQIEIECLPDKMIGHIDVDVSSLLTGQSIHVRDLKVSEGVKIFNDGHELIASVVAPTVEKAPAEAEVAAATAVAEPEVVAKKGKKEETPEKA